MNFEPFEPPLGVTLVEFHGEIFVSFLAERVYWISAVVQQGSERFVTVCDNITWYSVFRTQKYEDEVQIQTCRCKWHACMFIQHYVKNWQSVQSEASTSITLTLFAFHSIHSNLYIIDDVGFIPSVLWHCWLGGRKGIRPVKNWVVGCWCGCLSGARC